MGRLLVGVLLRFRSDYLINNMKRRWWIQMDEYSRIIIEILYDAVVTIDFQREKC